MFSLRERRRKLLMGNYYNQQGAPAIPVMAVSGNGNAITNGDGTPSSGDHTDFGSTAKLTTVTRTYTIENTGTADLNGLSVSAPAGYTVTVQPAATLAPAASTTFNVRFDATTLATYAGNVTIVSDELSDFTFAITGAATFLASILAYSPLAFYDAGLSSVWEDSARTTPALDNADVVGAWDDLSGNGYHYTQSTTGNKPTLRLNVQNGLPVIRLDGTDDVLITGDVVLPQAHTIISVWNDNKPTQTSAIFSYATSAVALTDVEQAIFNNTGKRFRIRYTGLDTFGSAVSAALDNMAIMSQRRASTTDAKAYINGALHLDSADVTTNFSTPRKFRMGTHTDSTQPANGDMATQIIFGTALSTTDRAAVEALLNERWAVY